MTISGTPAAPARPGKYTSLPPDQAAARLVELLTSGGAVITTQTANTITGVVHTRNNASCLVATLLFLIFIVPAIIYMLAASKDTTDPFSLTLVPEGTGTRLHGDGQGRGLAAVNWAADQQPR